MSDVAEAKTVEEAAASAADPRLSFEDVARLVSVLETDVVRELAEGPLPEGRCRLCKVLKPLTREEPAAAALHRWHEFFEETPMLDLVTKSWRRFGPADRHKVRAAHGEWKRLSGMLSYARGSMVYFAAQVELHRREP